MGHGLILTKCGDSNIRPPKRKSACVEKQGFPDLDHKKKAGIMSAFLI